MIPHHRSPSAPRSSVSPSFAVAVPLAVTLVSAPPLYFPRRRQFSHRLVLSSDLLASAKEVQASMGITSLDGASLHSSRPGVRRSASRSVMSAGGSASFVVEGGVPSSIEDNVKKRLSWRGLLERRSSSRPGSMVSFASALKDEGITPVTEGCLRTLCCLSSKCCCCCWGGRVCCC